MIYLLPIPIIALWLVGGQGFKAARRFGIPGVAIVAGLWHVLKIRDRDQDWAKLFFIFLCAVVLSMGYGINSWLMRWLKDEEMVRLVYGLLLALPIMIMGYVMGHGMFRTALAGLIITGSFQVMIDRSTTVWGFEILWDDVVRALAFSVALLIILV